MINLTQDADGFIRMPRHFPKSLTVSVTFTDGTKEEFTGAKLNELYDAALADFRAGNNMDAKGFPRAYAKPIHRRNAVELVPVQPGMSK